MADLREWTVLAAVVMTGVIALIWAAGVVVGLLAWVVRLVRGK